MKDIKKINYLKQLIEIVKSEQPYNQIGKEDFIKDIYSFYAGDFHVGKIEIKTYRPKSVLENDLVDLTLVPYNSYNYSEEYFVNAFKGIQNIDVEIKIHPVKGYSFTDDEKDFLEIITSFIYIYNSRKKLDSLINDIRIKDILTGAATMQGQRKFIKNINERGCSDNYATIYMNIQNFKYINQLFKHEKADIILRMFCQNILSRIDEEELLCRPGGDNFILIAKKENLKNYLDYLLSMKIFFDNIDLELKSTIGYCEIDENTSISESIDNASIVLNMARVKKGNAPFKFTDELKRKLMQEKKIKGEIKKAIKNGELINYYQPKVDIDSNEIFGAEVLARWKKEGKILAPRSFIEVLEKENMITELDYYILNETCKDIVRWLSNGVQPVKVSVNFSMKHLQDEYTADNIINILNSYGIPSNLIEIELTEITNIEDTKKMIGFIKKLKDANITVAMDDFGAGYSSLNMLKKIDYDVVKLDKAMIDSIENNANKDIFILRNIINMLNELNIDVIAEGVESERQVDILSEYSCKKIQGYYFDKPLPKQDFEKRLNSRSYTRVRK